MEAPPDRGQHPNDAELDTVRTGEADPATRRHVKACSECTEHLEFLALLAEELGSAELAVGPPSHDGVFALIDLEARRIRAAGRARTWRRAAMAAAAVLLAAIGLMSLRVGDSGLPSAAEVMAPAELQPLRGDIDGSGEVDILDAFAMARAIDGAESVPVEWDMNRDGVVDVRDVDHLARAAVLLERSTT